jgi:hypothetical protein
MNKNKLKINVNNIFLYSKIFPSNVANKILNKFSKNKNWKFIPIPEADFRVERSNCILNTDKIKNLGLELEDVNLSIVKAIKQYKERMS